MSAPVPASACLHCGRSAIQGEKLCAPCAASVSIRRLYVPRPGRPPGWEARLRELTRRAALRLPLFDAPLPPV